MSDESLAPSREAGERRTCVEGIRRGGGGRGRPLLLALGALLLAFAWNRPGFGTPAQVALSGPTMGTTWSVSLAGRARPPGDVATTRAAIEERLETVNRLMSTWDPDSELSRFNRHASTDPFPLSSETLAVLGIAQEVSERTGGAFDATVAPLVAAWGFGARAGGRMDGPSAGELAQIRRRVGFRLLELDPVAGTVRKRQPDLECDLSAIAKGFAVDEVARALEALGWTDFLVEVGGEVRARGQRPGGGSWRVGIERPDAKGRSVQAVVALADRAMATSGDYRSFREQGGERRAHIVDPRSGRPVGHRLASVSVVHRDAVRADAWATALAVLGPEEGFALAEAEALAAYFVLRTEAGAFQIRSTRAFPALQ